MATLASTHRILVSHDWRELAEWVQAIEKLADMTDDEIDRVAGTAPDNLADAA
jgi:hypothetical protein